MTDDSDVPASPDDVAPRRRGGGASSRRAERRARLGSGDAYADKPLVTRPLVPASVPADADAPAAGAATLVITCGALVHELIAVARASDWRHLEVTAIPAGLHNRPELITGAVRAKIRAARERFARILVLYGDCGTGGDLDRMLAEEQVERIDGAHCYAFFTGLDAFERLAEEEIGTFYLTDFLARHFDRLILAGLAVDRHPELLAEYFRHYRRIVHLVQIPDAATRLAAEQAAARLGLPLLRVETGLGGLAGFLGATG